MNILLVVWESQQHLVSRYCYCTINYKSLSLYGDDELQLTMQAILPHSSVCDFNGCSVYFSHFFAVDIVTTIFAVGGLSKASSAHPLADGSTVGITLCIFSSCVFCRRSRRLKK